MDYDDVRTILLKDTSDKIFIAKIDEELAVCKSYGMIANNAMNYIINRVLQEYENKMCLNLIKNKLGRNQYEFD